MFFLLHNWQTREDTIGTRGLLLHHNNTSAHHTAAATLDYLQANCVQLVTQTSYFPDLAHWGFFLFPQVKQQLKGKQFKGVEDARAVFEGVITDMPQSTWSGAMVACLKGGPSARMLSK